MLMDWSHVLCWKNEFVAYELFTRQHDCLLIFGVNKQTIPQAQNDRIVTTRQLMGLFCKAALQALAVGAQHVHEKCMMTGLHRS